MILIELPDGIIKVSGKADPGKIRKKKHTGGLVDFIKFNSGYSNEHQQSYEPNKCNKKCSEIKENKRPAEVENKLKSVKYKRRIYFVSV